MLRKSHSDMRESLFCQAARVWSESREECFSSASHSAVAAKTVMPRQAELG